MTWIRDELNDQKIDARPLLSLVADRAMVFGTQPQNRTLYRALHRAKGCGYVSIAIADQICCKLLGLHPAEVFGDLWWELDRAKAAFMSLREFEGAS